MAKSFMSLAVMLTANTTKFQKGMQGATGKVRGMGKAVTNVSSRMKGMLGIIAGGGLLLLARQALKAADLLAKTADSLGVTTEALAGLQLAANITGVATENMNKALVRMVVNIGDASKGIGEAQEQFKLLGLNAEALAALPVDKQFGKIAEAINGLESQTEKATAAYRIFGRQGVALLNTLSLGEKGIASYGEEAKRLGIALSRQDASKLEQVNDAFTLMKTAIMGAVTAIVIDLAPVIKSMFDSLKEVAVFLGGAFSSSWAKGLALVAVFGTTMIVTMQVIKGFMLLLDLLKAKYIGLTIVQAIQQAFLGPAGWAALAASAAVAAGVVGGLVVAYKSLNKEMEGVAANAAKAQNKALGALGAVDQINAGSSKANTFGQGQFERIVFRDALTATPATDANAGLVAIGDTISETLLDIRANTGSVAKTWSSPGNWRATGGRL